MVVLLEHVRHPLQTDASLHKEVETESLLPARAIAPPARRPGIRAKKQLHKLRTQPVAKGDQSITKLGQIDRGTAILVEAIEEVAPRGQEAPQTAELVKVDRVTAVSVEEPDHHAHGVRVKRRVVAIDESAAQGGFAELAGAVFVYGQEERPQCVAAVGLGRGDGGRALGGCDGWAVVVVARGRRTLCLWGRRRIWVSCRLLRRGCRVAVAVLELRLLRLAAVSIGLLRRCVVVVP